MVARLEPERFAQVVAAHHEQHRDPASSLCLACVDVLGVSGAGLVLMSGGRSVDFIGVSDRVSDAVEQMEYTLGEGPCVAAYRTKVPVFDADLADEGTARWPEFRRGALAAGVHAAFGFPLLVDRICIGALNLYHDQSRRAQRRSGRRRARGGAVREPVGVGLAGRRPAGDRRVAARTGPEQPGRGTSSDRKDLGAGRDLARRCPRAVAGVRLLARPADRRRRRRRGGRAPPPRLIGSRGSRAYTRDRTSRGGAYVPRTRPARSVH